MKVENQAPELRRSSVPAGSRRRNGLLILIFHTFLWFLLTGNDGWLCGLFFISLASALSVKLEVNFTVFKPRHFPGLFVLYLRELLAAGLQVALTACHPKMPLNPRWVSYGLTARTPRTQMALAAILCLLPGTLSARVIHGKVQIHLLNADQPWRHTVEKLETRLMALMGDRE